MSQQVFSYDEAKALREHVVLTTKEYRDEYDRPLIPQNAFARVIGVDAWKEDDGEHFAIIAIQFSGSEYEQAGWLPKVVLVNKTTFEQHFRDIDSHAKTP